MKKAGKIIVFVSATLTAILSLAFIFIEGRLLFSGDYNIYADPSAGFTTAFFRFLTAIFTLGCSIPSLLVFSKKKMPSLGLWVEGASIILFFVAMLISSFLSFSNGGKPLYLTIPIRILGGLFILGAVLLFIGVNKKEESQNGQ